MTFNPYYEYVDDVIYKNLPPAELANKIDKYINKMIDPNKKKYVEISNNIYLAMFILLENAVKHSILDNEINILILV